MARSLSNVNLATVKKLFIYIYIYIYIYILSMDSQRQLKTGITVFWDLYRVITMS